jgi:hypothetical protein
MDEALTNDELTQVLRMVQNDLANIKERLLPLEYAMKYGREPKMVTSTTPEQAGQATKNAMRRLTGDLPPQLLQ